MAATKVEVGDYVWCTTMGERRLAICRWVGSILGCEQVGLEFEEPVSGGHSGTWCVNGKRYFQCPDGHGVFASQSQVTRCEAASRVELSKLAEEVKLLREMVTGLAEKMAKTEATTPDTASRIGACEAEVRRVAEATLHLSQLQADANAAAKSVTEFEADLRRLAGVTELLGEAQAAAAGAAERLLQRERDLQRIAEATAAQLDDVQAAAAAADFRATKVEEELEKLRETTTRVSDVQAAATTLASKVVRCELDLQWLIETTAQIGEMQAAISESSVPATEFGNLSDLVGELRVQFREGQTGTDEAISSLREDVMRIENRPGFHTLYKTSPQPATASDLYGVFRPYVEAFAQQTCSEADKQSFLD